MKNLTFVLVALFSAQSFATNYTCVDSNSESFLISLNKRDNKDVIRIYAIVGEKMAKVVGDLKVASRMNDIVTISLETPLKVDWSKTPEKPCYVPASPWVYFELNMKDLTNSKISVQNHYIANPNVESCRLPPVEKPESHPLICKKN